MNDETFDTVRVFDAPRERIWQEWTEPERFADWYGGDASEIPLDTVKMVRPGGAWSLSMFFGPDRHRIDWHGEYREVDEPERLVMTLTDQPSDAGAYALVTVILVDLGDGRTEMRFAQTDEMSPEGHDRAVQGWGKFFDRMDARLAQG